MANTTSTLLTTEEWQSLYEPPKLSNSKREEYFTFSETEINILYSFKSIDQAVYYAICYYPHKKTNHKNLSNLSFTKSG